MGSDKAEKKRLKAQIKFAKAQAKLAEAKQPELTVLQKNKASPALKFAEAVRGILYLLGSASLILAVVLQERGVWITLDEIVENLLVIRAGQVVLIVIALALFIYGLKHIRLVR
ncbi:hypothetical protein KAT92_03930 [Candidatus Babeliales bacterium]|nr:hypothetical protein [Candidatus Babeliales bacterium]